MNIEQMLEAEFRTVADGLDVPPPPITELVREGDKVRNRTRVYAAGLVAAAVAVIVTGLALADGNPRAADDHGPSTTSPSPSPVVDESVGFLTGDAPTVPYIVDEKLFVDGKRIPGIWEYLPETQIGGNNVVNWISEKGWVLVVDGASEVLPDEKAIPKLSPDGRFLAYTDGDAMILRDLAVDREIGRLPIEQGLDADGEYKIVLRGVDNSGRVFYGSADSYMWDGSGEPVQVTMPDGHVPLLGEIYEVRAGEIVVLRTPPDDPDGRLSLATVNDNGRVTLQDPLPTTATRYLSPDNSLVAWVTNRNGQETGNLGDPTENSLTVRALDSDQKFTIPLNDGTWIRNVQWESDDTLLILTGDRVVRCDVAERGCEYAVAP